jgi:hypothetical protein
MTLPAAVRPAGCTRSGLIRVASVPAGHVYVRHLADPSGGDGVVRLDDPVPPGPDVLAGQWWPPAMLSPGWVLDHHQEFDVFHVQFGFDAQDADRLGALVHALRAVRKPLVYTVHDLRNTHHRDPRAYDAHLNGRRGSGSSGALGTPPNCASASPCRGTGPAHPAPYSGPSFVIGVHVRCSCPATRSTQPGRWFPACFAARFPTCRRRRTSVTGSHRCLSWAVRIRPGRYRRRPARSPAVTTPCRATREREQPPPRQAGSASAGTLCSSVGDTSPASLPAIALTGRLRRPS